MPSGVWGQSALPPSHHCYRSSLTPVFTNLHRALNFKICANLACHFGERCPNKLWILNAMDPSCPYFLKLLSKDFGRTSLITTGSYPKFLSSSPLQHCCVHTPQERLKRDNLYVPKLHTESYVPIVQAPFKQL